MKFRIVCVNKGTERYFIVERRTRIFFFFFYWVDLKEKRQTKDNPEPTATKKITSLYEAEQFAREYKRSTEIRTVEKHLNL